MTDPTAAIAEHQHHLFGAGRLYGPSGFNPRKLKTTEDTISALRDGVLYPSVTNVIGVLPKKHLQGWFGREAVKALDATFDIVEKQRQEALASLVANGVDLETIISCSTRDVPPSLACSAKLPSDVDKARVKGARWVRVASLALSGKHSPEHLRSVMNGGKVGAEPVRKALYARFMDGEISQTAFEQEQTFAENAVLDVLREHQDGWWVYSVLGSDTKGVALLGNAAARSRDTAADYGTEVHDLLERLSLSDDPLASYAGPHGYHVRAWQKWWTEASPDKTAPELTVRGKTPDGLPYAGTADLFCVIDGVGAVVDYKTSRSLDERSVALQLSALAHADEVPFDIELGIGLHVPRPEDAKKLLRFARPDQEGYKTYKDGYRAFRVEGDSVEFSWRLFCSARLLWQEMYAS